MNFIKVVVPVYNCEKWISKAIQSIKNQTHKDFKCVILDDMSTDNTFHVVQKEIENDDRFLAVLNTERKYPLKNFCDGIKIVSSDDEDILITVDGDDWLNNEFVFEKIHNIYEEKKCLITYGCFVEWPSGHLHEYFLQPYSNHVIENNLFREVPWKASHLRTFKKKLWDKIKVSDLINSETGNFYEAAGDCAQMFPMLEMAGNRSEHVRDILYVYNKENPLSEMYSKLQQALACTDQIRKKLKYVKVDFDVIEKGKNK